METQSSLQTLPIFFAFFVLIYFIAYFAVFRNWPPAARPEAASCLISIFHGTPAVVLASAAILADPLRSFSSHNTASQNSVLEFSVAYFLIDLLHYLVFYPTDVLFIGHHLATLFVFLTCRYLTHHGAYAILTLLILAEVTSACQNVWTLASARRLDNAFAAKMFDALSPPFYSFYLVVRGFLGPYFVLKMGSSYISGVAEGFIPKWVWLSWLVVVGLAISGSILWISNLWAQLYRERSARMGKKLT